MSEMASPSRVAFFLHFQRRELVWLDGEVFLEEASKIGRGGAAAESGVVEFPQTRSGGQEEM
jgi:hypothetical protein